MAHAGVFSQLLEGLHDVFAFVLGEGLEGQTDDVAVVFGCDPQVGCQDGLLDIGQVCFVPGMDHDQNGFRD